MVRRTLLPIIILISAGSSPSYAVVIMVGGVRIPPGKHFIVVDYLSCLFDFAVLTSKVSTDGVNALKAVICSHRKGYSIKALNPSTGTEP